MEKVLRKLQLTQLEILKIIDKICKEYNLKYSLYAGTLLGAARHSGFIPWDDDLDICMLREDYDKFLNICNEVIPEGYILQHKENCEAFTQSFAKIRKKGTTFLQYDFERGRYHTGIFVDIFPIDRIPNERCRKLLYKWNCMKYQLFTREFIPMGSNFVIKLGSKIFLKLVTGEHRILSRQKALNEMTKYDNNCKLDLVGIETLDNFKIQYPRDLFDETIEMKFEDGAFPVFANWKLYLKLQYGDYLQLPPEEEREWKHHPIILDFEHEYGEI